MCGVGYTGENQAAPMQERHDALVSELMTLPEKIRRVLEEKERLQWFSTKISNAKDIFFIGRGLDYALPSRAA
jgi:glucosamine--fructose-6-phosphate aminotransferase (isomerizing)